MFARHFIDSLDFARNGRDLDGVVQLAAMSRLQDLLADQAGEVSYSVHGVPDKDGKPMLEVAIEGICRLRCQRCLNAFDYPLKLASRLFLASPEEMEALAEDDGDDSDSILADKHLDVQGMIEDEMLLSLPFAPKHPDGECSPAVEHSGNEGRNPFAVLASLKK